MTEPEYYRLKKPIYAQYDREDDSYMLRIPNYSEGAFYNYLNCPKSDFDELFVPLDVEATRQQIHSQLEALYDEAFKAGMERAKMTRATEMVLQGEYLQQSFELTVDAVCDAVGLTETEKETGQ